MLKPYKSDPRWQAARAEWIDGPRPDEAPTPRMIRSILGAVRMGEIELEYEEAEHLGAGEEGKP